MKPDSGRAGEPHPCPASPVVRRDASLKAFNSFAIEARAERLVELREPGELPAALDLLREHPPAAILGGGSNVLITRDLPGTVLQVALAGRRVLGEAPHGVLVEAAAGESWHAFVQWTLAQGLSGLENLSLIPGSVGASPIQNIGAYGVEMRERFDSLDAVSLRDGTARRFDAAECAFGYRDSAFKHLGGGEWLITAVRFRHSRTPLLRLDYGEIREELRAMGIASPTPPDVARAVCAIRRRKLPDPVEIGNAGSFFKTPVVAAGLAERLRQAWPELPVHPAVPATPAISTTPAAPPSPDGPAAAAAAKLSAAWLIERCGWKGHRDGDAGVHERHALVLVNHGHASGAQILALAMRIRESVRQRFGIELETEPVVL